MNISFGVEEYFEQLNLMEQQYGQEEDLYPWIYMLLQMAECKKAENLKEEYKKVSIRDTHNWKKKAAPITMEDCVRKKILDEISSPKGGAPEFLIMDDKSKFYLGCVEIKKLFDQKWTSLNTGAHTELKTNVRKRICEKEKGLDLEQIIIEIEEELQNRAGCNIIRIRHRSSKNWKKQFVDVYEVCGEEEFSKDVEVIEYYEQEQLGKHLQRFGKILYTDGLEFYLLKLDKTNTIYIERLANLRTMYRQYRMNKKNESSNLYPKWNDQADLEWDNLKKALSEITWFDEARQINEEKKFV